MIAMRCLAVVLLFTAVLPGLAAPYPERPVRFIVPFPPAGGTDIVARLLSQNLTESLGRQFIVDNRPGAASTIGAGIAAKAAPDGYTLLFVTASYAISASYYKKLPYDSINDFTALSLIASGPMLFVVHPAIKANSLMEFVSLAKGTPAKVRYASGGAGGINHLAGELFNALAGTRLVHVPYKGAGPALTGVISGEAQVMIATLGSALPHIKSGRLKALAACGDRRAIALPDVPTVAESGVRGYAAENWYGLLAPHGTPRAIVNALNREVSSSLNKEETRAQLLKLGFEPMTSTPAQFGAYLMRDIDKWARVMRSAGIGQGAEASAR